MAKSGSKCGSKNVESLSSQNGFFRRFTALLDTTRIAQTFFFFMAAVLNGRCAGTTFATFAFETFLIAVDTDEDGRVLQMHTRAARRV